MQQIKNRQKASNINAYYSILLLAFFLFLFGKAVKSQVVLRVNYAAPATSLQNGSSWDHAYTSLQTAIENASNGSQIWVARGTYKPSAYPIGTTDGTSARDNAFTLKNNIAIYGGFSGTETVLSQRNIANNSTVLSGDIGVIGDNSDNCFHIVLGDYINNTAELNGFIIRDGNANTNNITTHTPSGHILPSNGGGGIFLNFASPVISNCVISNNNASYTGGGVVAQGRSDEIFNNCVFANNSVSSSLFGGAGLFNFAHPSNPSYPSLNNCVFFNNISMGAGGAIYTQYSNMTIKNCTIYNNTAQLWGGGIYNEDASNMVIKNCVVWGNIGNSYSQPAGSDAGLTWNSNEPNVSYSLLQTYSTYSSNISANPLFINSSNPIGVDGKWGTSDDGLRLSACSPAIDAGNAAGVPIIDITNISRPQGLGFDMGAYEYTSIGGGIATITPSVSIIAARNNVCYGATTYITATPIDGGTAPMYNFYVDGIPQGNSTTPTFNTSLLSIGLHTVYCVMMPNNICQTNNSVTSNAININVGNITVLPSIGGAINSCLTGFTSRLFNTIGAGVWTSGNLSVATINNTTGVVTSLAAGVTNIIFTYTNSFGCVSNTNLNFTVAPIGHIEQIVGPSTVCVGSTIYLSNATTGGVWSSVAGRASVNSSGLVTGTSSGLAQIRYTISNAFGCSAFVGKAISVVATPPMPSIQYAPGLVNPQRGAGGGNNFCNTRTFSLVGIPSGGIWSSGNPSVLTINSPTGIANTISIGTSSLTYTYTSLAGCSNSRTILGNVVNCAGSRGANLEDIQAEIGFNTFPNPAKNFVNIQVDRIQDNATVVITDLLGKKTLEQSLSIGKNTINTSTLGKGLYLITLITKQGISTKKLIIE